MKFLGCTTILGIIIHTKKITSKFYLQLYNLLDVYRQHQDEFGIVAISVTKRLWVRPQQYEKYTQSVGLLSTSFIIIIKLWPSIYILPEPQLWLKDALETDILQLRA